MRVEINVSMQSKLLTLGGDNREIGCKRFNQRVLTQILINRLHFHD